MGSCNDRRQLQRDPDLPSEDRGHRAVAVQSLIKEGPEGNLAAQELKCSEGQSGDLQIARSFYPSRRQVCYAPRQRPQEHQSTMGVKTMGVEIGGVLYLLYCYWLYPSIRSGV